MPDTHVFENIIVAASGTLPQVTSNNGGVTQAPTPINGGTDPDPVGGINHMGASVLASQYTVQTKSVYEHHNNDVSDLELSLFISDLQKAWNLK